MFLKNKNVTFKIRRSKVTDYAALISGVARWDSLESSFEPKLFHFYWDILEK